MPAVTKTLATQKVAAYFKLATNNEKLWYSLIVFLGALFLIGSAPFYPVYIVPLLALVCGFIAYRKPQIAVLLGMLFALPAISYQSPAFGLLFLLIFALAMFEVWQAWMIVAALEVFVLAPFAFPQFPVFGWITILGMSVAALHFGSKKSILISIPSVFFILLLSSIWLIPNSAFMPVRMDIYKPGDSAMFFSKNAVGILQLPAQLGASIGSLIEGAGKLTDLIGLIISNIIKILFSDSGFIQMAAWAIALYLMTFLSGYIKGPRSQLISSLALLVVIPFYYFISIAFKLPFSMGFVFAIGSSILLLALLEQFGVNVSREVLVSRKEKLKAYGKFGLQDLALGSAEKSLDAIGGYEDVKQELRDSILMPLEQKEIAYTYGIKPPSGILLFGPPGTGKTMMMRALANELKFGFYYIKSSDILSQWYGQSEANITEIFRLARENAPSILFFDEIDSLGKKRTSYSVDDVGPRILSVMLAEMDGVKTKGKPALVIGATNVPQQLDPALMRPGRFDKVIYMHLPEQQAREAIFNVHTKKIPLEPGIDFKKLAKKTQRFSGADIKNVVNEAVKLAAKDASKTGEIVLLSMDHFMQVLRYVKPSVSIASLDQYKQFRLDFERRVGIKEEEKPREEITRWEDVVGLDKVKKTLLEAIRLPLLHEDLMKEMKISPSKGMLLFGPPGTGKTLVVKAATNELKASFQVLSGAEIMKRGYTQAVSVIKETFNRARENTPSIIFVDEIETFAPARGVTSSEIVGQFLTEMDGLKTLKGVVIIAATNKPALLDPALLRPGRFDKIFYISPPDKKGRAQMFKLYLGKFAKDVDLDALASATRGFTGADIALVCKDAKMIVLRARIAGETVLLTTESVLSILKKRRPSVTKDLLKEYEQFLDVYGERDSD
jgi:SpoVK/Ycf46/Vps4 family AAA+-type ATPase